MSGRFPGARSVTELWDRLCLGLESVSFFTAEELEAAGVEPALVAHERYVPAKGVVEDADTFDADFFGFTPREAEILDPQHRLFLECSWQALEDAACDPTRYAGLIGVYAGAGAATYLMSVLIHHQELLRSVGAFQVMLSNDKDHLPTRVSYKLGLTGPSMGVQSACSTSLVAVHQACQALLAYECDLALAGGVTIAFPQHAGYLYQEGGVLSPDGHCRAFDARARGTSPGSGVGVAALKRLDDALAERDAIYAVVRGSAVNNDGSAKVGYTAPSVDGQAEVIAAALAMADVDARSITYVETHGTATPLGDPIEIMALTRAFRDSTEEVGFCAMGSIKTNVGHLDTASGVAGFIKTVQALHHRQLPPSLHFTEPNPELQLEESPFYVNTALREWENGPDGVRRAGVSSFGIGGTNAHVVLEEAPDVLGSPSPRACREAELLVFSARSPEALDTAVREMAMFLEREAAELCDVAGTLQTGRRAFAHRRAMVGSERHTTAAALTSGDPRQVWNGVHPGGQRGVAFLFPGQGAQHVDMGAGLYRTEPVFRAALDRAAESFAPHLGLDLRRLLYPETGSRAEASRQLARTSSTQPALFAVGAALVELWRAWGVEPRAMLGHSVGELVAAWVAEVLDFDAAVALVAARGRLLESLPEGAMLAVALAEAELSSYLGGDLCLAAVNGPAACTVSGPMAAVAALESELVSDQIPCRRLHTSRAFHSTMTEPILAAWADEVARHPLAAPQLPFLSNVTGDWMTEQQARDPQYWVDHLRSPVRFAAGCLKLTELPHVLLEVGPGTGLRTLLKQNPEAREHPVFSSLGHPTRDSRSNTEQLLAALGQLWIHGVEIDWQGFQAGRAPRRVHLPTYPFERQRFWAGGGENQSGKPEVSEVSEVSDGPAPRPETATRVGASTAASTTIEKTLVAIWRDLLGVREIAADDDFFELGGSSLMAVRLMERIEEELGVPLAASVLLEGATVGDLSLRLATARTRSPLVELRPGTRRPGIFWIHPIGGEVLCYLELSRQLDGQRPIRALQAAGLHGGEPRRRIEDSAALYVEAMRGVEPHGPYVLGGWSFGGLVAYEMACQLEAAGETVEFLALLDSWPRTATEELDEASLLAWFFRDLVGVGADAGGIAPTAEELGQIEPETRFDEVLERARRAELLPSRGGEDRLRRLYRIFVAHAEALAAYRPGPWRGAGKVVLFEATAPAAAPGGAEIWHRLTGHRPTTHAVVGDHYDLVKLPRAGLVAARLLQYLENDPNSPTPQQDRGGKKHELRNA